MKATLVSKPKFCIPFLEGKSITEGIIYLARITSEQQENESYTGLMKHLMREGHWSPFDMLNLVIEVECERDVSRQILRHPFFVQEWSQRYGNASNLVGKATRKARMQDVKNRQNSYPCDDGNLKVWWELEQQVIIAKAIDTYDKAIDNGIAKEVARSILPEGLTSTRMYLNGTVRQFLFYLKARCDMSTQLEHRILAHQIRSIIKELMPETLEAFEDIYMSK